MKSGILLTDSVVTEIKPVYIPCFTHSGTHIASQIQGYKTILKEQFLARSI